MSLRFVYTTAEGRAVFMRGRLVSSHVNDLGSGRKIGLGKKPNIGKIIRVIFGIISLISSLMIRNTF